MSKSLNSAAGRRTTEAEMDEDIWNNFQGRWDMVRLLGRGGDGMVYCYQNNDTQQLVAVKVPSQDMGGRLDKGLLDEIRNLKVVGKHQNIVEMIGSRHHFIPNGPAIILTYCDLGDLTEFRQAWIMQAELKNLPLRVSEDTIWKLLHDMAHALDHIHNKLGQGKSWRYVHTDVKSTNILCSVPLGYSGEDIPEQPLFKLADFTRLTTYPSSKTERGYGGTFEFAPPMDERMLGSERPSGDLWGLGATIQHFAFGIWPTQSRRAYIENLKSQGISPPHPFFPSSAEDWHQDFIRSRIPVVFRPLDVSMKELQAHHDVPVPIQDYQPFSPELNEWNGMLMTVNPRRRVTAAALVSELAPFISSKMKAEKMGSENVDSYQPDTEKMGKAPNYDGEGYGITPSRVGMILPQDQ